MASDDSAKAGRRAEGWRVESTVKRIVGSTFEEQGFSAPKGNMTAINTPVVDASTVLAGAHRIARCCASRAPRSKRRADSLRPSSKPSGHRRLSMACPGLGGPQVDLLAQVAILEVLSAADASAGWCAMIGADSGFYGAALSDADGRELYPELDLITAWFRPSGRDIGGHRRRLPAVGALVVR